MIFRQGIVFVPKCHSGLSRILLNPSLEKRGRGDFMENRLIQKIPLCQRGKMQGKILYES
jgi:hypothetical protein